MKHREQNTGFCYIPDAKFPGGFCDLAGFGLRFLIKSCTLHAWVFREVLPRSVNRCFFMVQGEPGSFLWQQTELGGEIPQIQVFNSCNTFSPQKLLALLFEILCPLAGWERRSFFIQVFILPPSLYLLSGWFFVQNKTCTRRLVKDVRLFERKKIFFSGYVAQLPWYPSTQNRRLPILKPVEAGLAF